MNLAKLLLLSAVLLSSFTCATRRSGSFKPKSSEVLQSEIATFRSSDKFRVEYDRFKNFTSVNAGEFYTFLRSEYETLPATIFLHTNFDGATLNKPAEHVSILISAVSDDWHLRDNKELNFIADGKRLNAGVGEYRSDILSGGKTYEALAYTFSRSDAEQIFGAVTTEYQLGVFEGELPLEIQRAMKDLLQLTGN